MKTTIEVQTAYNQDMITQSYNDVFDNTVKYVINLQEQAVREALRNLGWVSPEEATDLKLKAKRYEWIKDNIQEEVTQLADGYVGVKTKYVLPYLHAYAEFTGQISFDNAVDAVRLDDDKIT